MALIRMYKWKCRKKDGLRWDRQGRGMKIMDAVK
jgi:hypothetical protein